MDNKRSNNVKQGSLQRRCPLSVKNLHPAHADRTTTMSFYTTTRALEIIQCTTLAHVAAM
jgi:hypothetical protein